jgi:hypothetical protein
VPGVQLPTPLVRLADGWLDKAGFQDQPGEIGAAPKAGLVPDPVQAGANGADPAICIRPAPSGRQRRPELHHLHAANHAVGIAVSGNPGTVLFAVGLVIAWPRGDNPIRRVNDACDRAEFGAV